MRRELPMRGRSKVKNYLFRKAQVGTIDLHYRDYEEPPGNGGFLLNGGRLYLDMGHIEYASPECLHLRDIVTYDLAGDELLQSALVELGASDRVSFIKNNVDHHTGATFGCHENYLMRREAQFTPPVLGTLLSFLATRQLFTGAGRVGQANPLAFDFEMPQPETQIDFQISQRADHIVNDIYQWVQFNRAIINARDEPLADYRKYRRLHLLIGDSNMSPFATALKVGTTACVLSLLEDGRLPEKSQSGRCRAEHARYFARHNRGDGSCAWKMERRSARSTFNGSSTNSPANNSRESTKRPIGCSRAGSSPSKRCRKNRNRSSAASIGSRRSGCSKLSWKRKRSSGAIRGSRAWTSSITTSIRRRGFSLASTPPKRIGEWNDRVRRTEATLTPPANTRASGRARAVAFFQQRHHPYVINWDSIACDSRDFLVMGDPFNDYNEEVGRFLSRARASRRSTDAASRVDSIESLKRRQAVILLQRARFGFDLRGIELQLFRIFLRLDLDETIHRMFHRFSQIA